MIAEGSMVVYCGEDVAIGVGTRGTVVSCASGYQHVRWSAGERTGSIDIVPDEDLIRSATQARSTALSTAQQFDDSLDTPVLAVVAVRGVYDDFGEDGVLNVLSETGHLAALGQYAGEVVGHVAALLRSDPNFAAVLGQLDEQESDSLLTRVAIHLLQTGMDG